MIMELPSANETPEQYVLVETIAGYHVLAGWSGSYLYGASCRLSTNLKKVLAITDEAVLVETRSGSTYKLYKSERRYGMTSMSGDMYAFYKEKADAEGTKFSVVPFENINEIFEGLTND